MGMSGELEQPNLTLKVDVITLKKPVMFSRSGEHPR